MGVDVDDGNRSLGLMMEGNGKQEFRATIDDIPITLDHVGRKRKTTTLFLYINHTLAITHNLYYSVYFD